MLPKEIWGIVRSFASDRGPVHPAAALVKRLRFSYLPPTASSGVYHPQRLEVRATDAFFREPGFHFKKTWRGVLVLRFYTHNFAPSSWSLYC